MQLLVRFAILALVAVCASALLTSYEGHQVLRFKVNKSQAADLAALIKRAKLDLWAEIPQPDGSILVDVRVASSEMNLIQSLDFSYSTMIPNLEHLIQSEKKVLQSDKAAAGFFDNYHTLDEFFDWMASLQKDYPDLVTPKAIGKSLEGRSISGITITSKKNTTDKFGILYNGGQHAREWIGPMTVSFIANELLTKYGKDDQITRFVDNIEWTIIPVLNPDGYVYTWTTDRMWRKNRRLNKNSGWWEDCYGVDNNRNWDFKWGTAGSSDYPCDEAYQGPSGFSEPEETALAQHIKSNPHIKGYIDFHSYSQLWMNPWGWTSALPADDKVQKEVSIACVEAIKNTHGKVYQSGNIESTIYPASGSSVDWTYGVGNVTFSFAVELRDTGTYGFVLPPNQIVPTGEEIMAAVRVMGDYMLKYYAN